MTVRLGAVVPNTITTGDTDTVFAVADGEEIKGVPQYFADRTARDAWATKYPARLTVGQEVYIKSPTDQWDRYDGPLPTNWTNNSRTGGGGGAPTTAKYVTLATDATLTNERVLTAGTGISITDGGAGGPVTISINSAGVAYFRRFFTTLSVTLNQSLLMRSTKRSFASVTIP